MTNPQQIDILMATYNGERFVDEQIASIQTQTYSNWRLLVSDDCSRDGTLDVVRSIAAIDERIIIVSEGVRHGGAVTNFMYLLSCSEAPYVMFCDQDDVWLPEKIETSLRKMHELECRYGEGVPLLAFSDMAVVDEDLNLMHASFERFSGLDPSRTTLKNLLVQNVAAGCTMILNRELAELCEIEKRIDTEFDIGSDSQVSASDVCMHDWWTMLVAASLGHIEYVDVPLSLYRQHGNNAIGAHGFEALGPLGSSNVRVGAIRTRIAQAITLLDRYGDRLAVADAMRVGEYVAIGRSTSYVGGVCTLFAVDAGGIRYGGKLAR